MLAIKLHKKPKPFLGQGSYLVTVPFLEKAHRDVRNWIAMLNHHNRFFPNNKILYVTLVRITDVFHARLTVTGLSTMRTMSLAASPRRHEEGTKVHWIEGSNWDPAAIGSFAQLILGATIPSRSVLWTKNARLLFRGDLKRKGKALARPVPL